MSSHFSSKVICILSFFIFCAKIAFAHGEAKPGPNGGHIRMPGSFHTELVPGNNADEFMVYLIDMTFKHPTIENSEVRMFYRSKHSTNAQCSANKDHFKCSFPKGTISPSGRFEIQARRQGIASQVAVYDLPLKFADSMDHSKHKR